MSNDAQAKPISQEEDPPPCSLGNVYSQEQKRDISQILHHLEARQEVYAMMPEQAGIYQHEIGFARAQECAGPSHNQKRR